jgi:hypothetical protein
LVHCKIIFEDRKVSWSSNKSRKSEHGF